jgi:hypothetical protein
MNCCHVLHNLFPADLVVRAATEWPVPDWPGWLHYDTPLECKRTCHDWKLLPPACAELLRGMLCGSWHHAVGQPHAVADVTLHGAGMHDMGPEDYLDLHLDADSHPLTGLERAVNAILFLEPWQETWGGNFELWDERRTKCVASVPPRAGSLLVFETTDTSYHGVPDPVRCPEGVRRKSLAVYWWKLPTGKPKRPRALFVGRAGEYNTVKKAHSRARSR